MGHRHAVCDWRAARDEHRRRDPRKNTRRPPTVTELDAAASSYGAATLLASCRCCAPAADVRPALPAAGKRHVPVAARRLPALRTCPPAALPRLPPSLVHTQNMCERLHVPCVVVAVPKSIDNDMLMVRAWTQSGMQGSGAGSWVAMRGGGAHSRFRVLLCRIQPVAIRWWHCPCPHAPADPPTHPPNPCMAPLEQLDKCFGFETAVEEAQKALLAAKVDVEGRAPVGAGAARHVAQWAAQPPPPPPPPPYCTPHARRLEILYLHNHFSQHLVLPSPLDRRLRRPALTGGLAWSSSWGGSLGSSLSRYGGLVG